MTRWRFVGVVIAGCFLAVLLPVLAIFHFDPLCSEEGRSEQTSPDGQYVAASLVRNCGATTDFVAHVNLRPSMSKFRPDFFGGTIKDGEIATINHWDGGVIFCWISSRHLNIDSPPPEHQEWAKHRWRDVEITYDSCP